MMACQASVWGKLPAFGDFIRSRASAAQVEDWRHWFQCHPIQEMGRRPLSLQRHGSGIAPDWHRADAAASASVPAHPLPWSFVLSPGCLPFSGNRFVAGVMIDSCDKVGRRHPLVIFQVVSGRWLVDALAQPRNALFWQARLIARYMPTPNGQVDVACTAVPLDVRLARLFDAARPGILAKLGLRRAVPPQDMAALLGPEHQNDIAGALRGTASAPWSRWPHCLTEQRNSGWFWQQDRQGHFVGCHRITVDRTYRYEADVLVGA
ncbi:type VI secretion system-associated protein TagF [Ralstonia sp. 25C]|uniref:type VI secretion system-associated protein TagF n=1 Tax=Ralstonia sp. 25C TaxID=3447363 RepID=UPI003F74F183